MQRLCERLTPPARGLHPNENGIHQDGHGKKEVEGHVGDQALKEVLAWTWDMGAQGPSTGLGDWPSRGW